MPGDHPPPPIDRDLPCIACGYNLRGLGEGGTCPECGLVVEASLRAVAGGIAAGPARRRIALGLRLLALSMAATVFSPVLGVTAVAIESAAAGAAWGLWIVAEHVLWAAGVWRATAWDRAAGVDVTARQGIAARVTAVATLVLMVLLIAAFASMARSPYGLELLLPTMLIAPLIGLARAGSVWWLGGNLLRTGAAAHTPHGPGPVKALRAVVSSACLAFAAAFPLAFAGGAGVVIYVVACIVLWFCALIGSGTVSTMRRRLLKGEPARGGQDLPSAHEP